MFARWHNAKRAFTKSFYNFIVTVEILVPDENKVLHVKVEVAQRVDFRITARMTRVGQDFNAEFDVKVV